MLDKCSFLTWCWFLRISLLDAIIKYMFRADQKSFLTILGALSQRFLMKTPNIKNATGYSIMMVAKGNACDREITNSVFLKAHYHPSPGSLFRLF